MIFQDLRLLDVSSVEKFEKEIEDRRKMILD